MDHWPSIASRISPTVEVRAYGLLESALARPQTVSFGTEVYPRLTEKAAALSHSLVSNHGLGALITFLGLVSTVRFCP